MSLLLAALFFAEATVNSAAADPVAEPDPKSMNMREIKAFNAKLPKNHPYYIRCVSALETGSLVKRTYSCRTNKQWQLADQTANQNARDTYEAMQGKAISGNN